MEQEPPQPGIGQSPQRTCSLRMEALSPRMCHAMYGHVNCNESRFKPLSFGVTCYMAIAN